MTPRRVAGLLESRRAPPLTPREPPPPSLAGPRAYFLDHRAIRHVTRQGGVGVLWPRAIPLGPAKEVPREGRRGTDAGMGGGRS